jgi:hypothetical protein
MSMPKVSGQNWQPTFGIITGSVPTQQRLNGKTMPKIMEAGAMTRIHRTQSDLPGQRIERAMNLAFVQMVAILID